jgi:chromosome segregation ATPase
MRDAQSHYFSHCPHCSAGLRIRRVYLGQQVLCKHCDQVFVALEGPDEGGGVPGATPALPLPVGPDERIDVTCPNCNAALSVRRDCLGRQVRCKQCDLPFVVADLPGPRPSGLEQDRFQAGNGPDVQRDELQRLRSEREQICGENQRLQAARDQIRAEHERLQAAHGEIEAAHVRLQASHADLRTADRALASEIEELRAAHDRIAAARNRLQAERDEAAKDRAGLAAERDDHRARGDRLQAERDRLAANLGSIRGELGQIAPGEVRVLAEERTWLRPLVERLRSEEERLGGEVEMLRRELASSSAHRSALENSALTQQRQWDAELQAARDELDRLAALVCDRDANLAKTVAERNRFRAEGEGATAEAEGLRVTVTRLEREQRERVQRDGAEIERLRAEIDRLCAESHRLAELVRDREAELKTAVAERDRFRAEGEGATADAEGLRLTVTRLEREQQERVQQDGAEIERLRTEIERFCAETDRLSALVRDREAELETAVAERDRLSVERRSAGVQVERLRMALNQLERDYCERVERDGAELDQVPAMNEQGHVKAHWLAAASFSPGRNEEPRAAHARGAP